MWALLAQLQPQLTPPLSLPKWVTLEDFVPVSQGYEGGNVMVEEAPTSLSPFPLWTVHLSLISPSTTSSQ